MPLSHRIFYSLFLIIIPAAASLILFFRIQRNQILATKFFFWNYAFGFAIFSLVHIPIFFINLGVQISYKCLLALNSISILAILISYLLFYRGSILLLTKERFITTVFPIFTLPIIAAMSIVSLFIFRVGTLMTYTALVWGFLLPNNSYLGALFLYIFIKGAPFDTLKRRPGALILGLAWFFVLASDVNLWLNAALYHPEFWILKVASLKGWLILRALAYLLILIGSLVFSKYPKKLEFSAKA